MWSFSETEKKIKENSTQLAEKVDKDELQVERGRIDLLTKVENGETEGNTELLDLRVTIDGNTYDIAGNSIREQIKSNEDNINNKTEYINDVLINSLGSEIEPCILEVSLGAINVNNGFITGFGSQSWYKHAVLNCIKGDKFFVSVKAPASTSSLFQIAFTNERGKILSSYLPGKDTVIKYTNYEVIAPKGACKLYVQSYLENSEETITVKKEKINNVSGNINEINNDLSNSLGITKSNCSIKVELGALNVVDNKIIGFGTQTWFKHTMVNCKYGEVYFVTLKVPNSIHTLFCVAFTDSNDEIIETHLPGKETVTKYSDFILTVPKGAKKLYIQSFLEDSEETITLKKEFIKKISKSIDENVKRDLFGSRQTEFENIPTNSLIGFKHAYEHGYNSIRVSVCHTSDGVPVLIHDTIINSWCKNEDGTDLVGDININNITYEQALKYDFGIQVSEKWKGTKITKLEDCVKYCKAVGMSLNVEPKDGDIDKMKKIVDMIYKYSMVKQTCFQIDLWSQKDFLDGIANYSPYINLMVCGNYGEWLVNNAVSYVNNKRQVWIGAYLNDFPSAFTNELTKLCYDNGIKVGIPANSLQDLKERYAYFDRLELKNIEYPHMVLKEYINSLM